MGWLFDDTGAERAARIKGKNQAAEHARRREARQEDYERNQQVAWEKANWAFKNREYEADLAAWRNNPARYQRQYRSPADVPDLSQEAYFGSRPTAEPGPPESNELSPTAMKFIVAGIAVALVFAILQQHMWVIAPIINTVVYVLLSAGFLLVAAWIGLRLTAGDDPVKIRRAALFNPARIAKVIYGVVRDQIAERRARKTIDDQ